MSFTRSTFIRSLIFISIALITLSAFLFLTLQESSAASEIPAAGNLAAESIITSSSHISPYTAKNTVDGDDVSVWRSEDNSKEWVQYDLKALQPLKSVAILWKANTTKSYYVQGSGNGRTWSTLASGTTNGAQTQLMSHNVNTKKRYVRILTRRLHTGAQEGNSIREVGIYAGVAEPTISPTRTPTPKPKVTILHTSPSGFVTVCGTGLCLNGKPFTIHSATMYGHYDNPEGQLSLAVDAKLNTVEMVEYEKEYRSMSSVMSEETWARNDRFIAKAREKGLKVLLHFSSYGHALAKSGQKPTTADWGPFLEFVMKRKNTVTGVTYAEDPTIAKIQIYGEIDAPNYSEPMRGTTQETIDFYKRTLAQLRSLDKNHVISSGGFTFINDPNSGIDWKAIMADPNNNTCDIEVNSFNDRNITVPNVSTYCKSIGKPWFLAAWSSCQGTAHFNGDSNHWPTDSEMAAHAADMYKVAHNSSPAIPGPAMASSGTSFWNLGNSAPRNDNCDIGAQYPLTLDTLRQYAP